MKSQEIELRPCTAADAEFLFALYAATRAEELAGAGWSPAQQEVFLRQQFGLRERQYAWMDPSCEDRIIMRDGQNVGRVMVQRAAGAVTVVDIALLPPFRSCGIGSSLFVRLQHEAAQAGTPLRLHVEKHNRARLLYERLGFSISASDSMYCEMQWQDLNGAGA